MSKRIITARLILREWQDEDLEEFAKINQDPKVLEFMPGPLSYEETKQWLEKLRAHFIEHGFGVFAVEIRETGEFIGYVGLNVPTFTAHFTPCVEFAWRIATKHWGKGYATEAASAVLNAAFEQYGLEEIVAFTVPANKRSMRVMEKIGMQRDLNGDFLHPKLPKDHRLAQHVLYRISAKKNQRELLK